MLRWRCFATGALDLLGCHIRSASTTSTDVSTTLSPSPTEIVRQWRCDNLWRAKGHNEVNHKSLTEAWGRLGDFSRSSWASTHEEVKRFRRDLEALTLQAASKRSDPNTLAVLAEAASRCPSVNGQLLTDLLGAIDDALRRSSSRTLRPENALAVVCVFGSLRRGDAPTRARHAISRAVDPASVLLTEASNLLTSSKAPSPDAVLAMGIRPVHVENVVHAVATGGLQVDAGSPLHDALGPLLSWAAESDFTSDQCVQVLRSLRRWSNAPSTAIASVVWRLALLADSAAADQWRPRQHAIEGLRQLLNHPHANAPVDGVHHAVWLSGMQHLSQCVARLLQHGGDQLQPQVFDELVDAVNGTQLSTLCPELSDALLGVLSRRGTEIYRLHGAVRHLAVDKLQPSATLGRRACKVISAFLRLAASAPSVRSTDASTLKPLALSDGASQIVPATSSLDTTLLLEAQKLFVVTATSDITPRAFAAGLLLLDEAFVQQLNQQQRAALVRTAVQLAATMPTAELAQVVGRVGMLFSDAADAVTVRVLLSPFHQERVTLSLTAMDAAVALKGCARFRFHDAIAAQSLAQQVEHGLQFAPLAHIAPIAAALVDASRFSPKAFAHLSNTVLRQVTAGKSGGGDDVDGTPAVLEAFKVISDAFVLRRYRGSSFPKLSALVRARVLEECHRWTWGMVINATNAFAQLGPSDVPLFLSLATRLADIAKGSNDDQRAVLRRLLAVHSADANSNVPLLSASAAVAVANAMSRLAIDADNAIAADLLSPLAFSIARASQDLHPEDCIVGLNTFCELTSPATYEVPSPCRASLQAQAELFAAAYAGCRASFLHAFSTADSTEVVVKLPGAEDEAAQHRLRSALVNIDAASVASVVIVQATHGVIDAPVLITASSFASTHHASRMEPQFICQFLTAALVTVPEALADVARRAKKKKRLDAPVTTAAVLRRSMLSLTSMCRRCSAHDLAAVCNGLGAARAAGAMHAEADHLMHALAAELSRRSPRSAESVVWQWPPVHMAPTASSQPSEARPKSEAIPVPDDDQVFF